MILKPLPEVPTSATSIAGPRSIVDNARSFYTINEHVHPTQLTNALTMAKSGVHPIQVTNASIDKNFADKSGMTCQTAQNHL